MPPLGLCVCACLAVPCRECTPSSIHGRIGRGARTNNECVRLSSSGRTWMKTRFERGSRGALCKQPLLLRASLSLSLYIDILGYVLDVIKRTTNVQMFRRRFKRPSSDRSRNVQEKNVPHHYEQPRKAGSSSSSSSSSIHAHSLHHQALRFPGLLVSPFFSSSFPSIDFPTLLVWTP